MNFKILGVMFALLWAVSWIPVAAFGLDFPKREIEYYCTYGPGSNADNFARLLAKFAGKFIGKPIVVVTKVGGGGSKSYAALAAAKPDGYTIGGLGTGTIAQPYLFKGTNFHYKTSFTQICQMDYSAQGLIVLKKGLFDIPLEELLKRAKENPQTIKCAIGGTWTPQDFTREMFEGAAGVKFIKIPFPNAAEAIPALLGGHVDISFAPASEWGHLYKGGKINVLAVSTEERDPRFKDLPTFRELGYDVVFDVTHWVGAPKGLPEPILKFYVENFRKAFTDPGFVQAADHLGATAAFLGPEETLQAMDKRDEVVRRIFQKYGVKPK